MGKDKNRKDKKNPLSRPDAVSVVQGLSKRGKKVIGAGIALLVVGFIVLSLTDSAGQNWASTLSPFLILGAYAVIGVGIVLPDRPQNPAEPLLTPSNR